MAATVEDPLFIIAASYRSAEAHARQLGLTSSEWVPITGMDDAPRLMGRRNPRVELFGCGPRDLSEVEDLVRTLTTPAEY